jgi:vacuolar-type H+-ATPase subunit E/Vma4
MEEQKTIMPVKYESDELGELLGALSKAQGEMNAASMDKKNPFFKTDYADLSSVVRASRPALAKYGLSVIQRILTEPEGKSFLLTRLGHASGQWMESRILINPGKADIQSLGSYITYLRRYSYSALVGVITEDDDDGEKTMDRGSREVNSVEGKAPVIQKISKAQLEVLQHELEGREDLLESLFKGFGIDKLSDLESKHYSKCVERIREIKRAQEA